MRCLDPVRPLDGPRYGMAFRVLRELGAEVFVFGNQPDGMNINKDCGSMHPQHFSQRVKEFRDFSKEVKPGDVIGPGIFAVGDFVDAIGVTKGRGFEGVVGRQVAGPGR